MRYGMKMPDLAATESEIRIIRWLVEPGQKVERGQALVEVETDKVTMEVESPVSGVLTELRCQADEDVSVGQVIAMFEVEGAAPQGPSSTPGRPAPAAPPRPVPPKPSQPPAADSESPGPKGMFARSRTAAPREAPSDPAPVTAAPPPAAPQFLLGLYERMVRIRQFEDGVKFLFLEGIMPGTIHQCQGQEATAVGVCSVLAKDDFITSTFRGHGHALAKGLSVQELLDELFGAVTGCCKGKGGSMHVGNMSMGMIPGIAIVGGGIPVAAGMALAFRMRKSGQIAACFFGDGAVSEGAFHEGVNMAAIWSLPVIFACENNLYGASTHVSKVMRDTNIARRVAASYGIRAQQVDGNDVLAVHEAAKTAADECRAGKGPVFLELLTYRMTGHSRRDPCHYQPKEEREAWAANDPIKRFGEVLKSRAVADDASLEAIQARVLNQFNRAVEIARQAPLPSVEELTTDVFA